MTIIEVATESANMGESKPLVSPIERETAVIKEECELGIPPLLKHNPYSTGTFKNCPKNQDISAEINTSFAIRSSNIFIFFVH